MSDALENLLVQTERLKLSRLLHVPAADLHYLDALGSRELHALRERITTALFEQGAAMFGRVATASKLMPVSLIAKLSEHVFGAVLSARIAGYMPPDRAVEVATATHPQFLAEISKAMEPKRAHALLQRIPVKLVLAVSKILLGHQEYMVMARFVDSIPIKAITAVVDDTPSDEDLLRVACYVEDANRLEEITEHISDVRLKGIITAAAHGGKELQLAGLLLMGQVTDAMKRRIGDLSVEIGEPSLLQLLRAAQQWHAAEVLADVLIKMSPAAQSKAAELATQSPALRQALEEVRKAKS